MSVAKQPVSRIHEGCAPVLDPSVDKGNFRSSVDWKLALLNLHARMFFPDPVEAERYVDATIHYVSATLLFGERRKLTAAEIGEAEADIGGFLAAQ